MVEFNKIFENKPTTENKRIVLTYPQKSIKDVFGMEEKEQRELVNSVCELVTGKRNLTEHQKSLVVFGLLMNTKEKLITKK